MRTEDYQDLFELEEEFWWFVGMRQITAAVLDPLLRENVSRIVLDAGCGTGGNVAWLRRYAGASEVVGMDLASDALKLARQRIQQLPVQASVTELPFPDSTFDLVTSFDVIVQLPGEGADERAVREMYRVLTPGGIAFVRAAAYQWMRSGHDVALNTQRRYSLNELRCSAGRHRLSSDSRDIRERPSASDCSSAPACFEADWPGPVGFRCIAFAVGSEVDKSDPSGALALRGSVVEGLLPLPAGLSAICVVQKPKNT